MSHLFDKKNDENHDENHDKNLFLVSMKGILNNIFTLKQLDQPDHKYSPNFITSGMIQSKLSIAFYADDEITLEKIFPITSKLFYDLVNIYTFCENEISCYTNERLKDLYDSYNIINFVLINNSTKKIKIIAHDDQKICGNMWTVYQVLCTKIFKCIFHELNIKFYPLIITKNNNLF